MSTQVIDVKSKKPRAPKKVPTVVDTIPPSVVVPSEAVPSETVPSEAKPKKPRATKKVNDENASAPTDTDAEDKPKKPRTPTLPAKFAKFIKFNFFFINQLSDIDQETKDAYLNTFAVFAPVDQQTQLVTDYLLTQKTINKQYRDAISARKKAAAKANKPTRRSKKSVQVDFQNDLVNQLIESANLPSNDNNDKKPRGRKPKNDNNDASTSNLTKDAKDAKDKKPRGRKPKASLTNPPLNNIAHSSQPADDDDDEEDTQVTRFVHGGKSFLRDSENNLYDELSHEPVGTFDPNSNSVSLK
jgi:hypothetical protein